MTSTATASPSEPLTDEHLEILTFEQQWWRYPAAKETAVRDLFGMSMTRYYQLLNRLIDHPAALAHDPLLVRRLQRLRAARAHQRSARRLGFERTSH
ncbi:DUF3263 domain-containing protein [Nocardioides soli]|uniref:DUF3263 domain-containing protein n=1 Tax=Nocardioides soli TaxID=1036020 RepID=A0A7W4VTK8_9ACTN|nr:DUF3263 domain-containing protein [Nocardioides soli]MBB3041248.1 hypothetical protein [Nocardioides soli]